MLGELESAEHASFFMERFEADDSYLAQAEAVKALGRIADASRRQVLEKAATMESPRDVIATAARAALEALEKGSQD